MRTERPNCLPRGVSTRLFVAASVCAATLAVVGCGSASSGFCPVTGKVSVEGQPLRIGSVSFRPDTTKGNKTLHHPTGDIDAEGTYVLYTIGKKGAPPGWYRVIVFADGNPAPAPGIPPRWLHDVKYTNAGTTDLLIEVVETPPAGGYDLKLSR